MDPRGRRRAPRGGYARSSAPRSRGVVPDGARASSSSSPVVAVRQLHREFLRAGSTVMQTFTFYASDDKLENRGNTQSFTVSARAAPHARPAQHHCRASNPVSVSGSADQRGRL